MLLTAEERRKFAEWCRQEIASNEALVKQGEAINLAPEFVKVLRMKSAGCKIVADVLESTHEEAISNAD